MAQGTPTAQEIRDHLLAGADHSTAVEIANAVISAALDQLNDLGAQSGCNAGTSIVARIMVARGLQAVTSRWWNELTHVPRPITHAAVVDIQTNPPAEWHDVSWNQETGEFD